VKRNKARKLNELLKELEQPFDYLAWKFKLNHEDKKDVKQELKLMVIENFHGNINKKVGFWFIRAKWYLCNRLKKSKREPVNSSISLDTFTLEGKEENSNE